MPTGGDVSGVLSLARAAIECTRPADALAAGARGVLRSRIRSIMYVLDASRRARRARRAHGAKSYRYETGTRTPVSLLGHHASHHASISSILTITEPSPERYAPLRLRAPLTRCATLATFFRAWRHAGSACEPTPGSACEPTPAWGHAPRRGAMGGVIKLVDLLRV